MENGDFSQIAVFCLDIVITKVEFELLLLDGTGRFLGGIVLGGESVNESVQPRLLLRLRLALGRQ